MGLHASPTPTHLLSPTSTTPWPLPPPTATPHPPAPASLEQERNAEDHIGEGAKITCVTGVSPALLSSPRLECVSGRESCQVPELGLNELLMRLPKTSVGGGFGIAPKARGLAGEASRGTPPRPRQGQCWGRLERWVEAVRTVCPRYPARSKSAWIPRGPAGSVPAQCVRAGWGPRDPGPGLCTVPGAAESDGTHKA